jgi:predicted amidohydrolase YtcJ
MDGRKGSLEAGKDADIAVFDDDFSPWCVIIGGDCQFFSETPQQFDQQQAERRTP